MKVNTLIKAGLAFSIILSLSLPAFGQSCCPSGKSGKCSPPKQPMQTSPGLDMSKLKSVKLTGTVIVADKNNRLKDYYLDVNNDGKGEFILFLGMPQDMPKGAATPANGAKAEVSGKLLDSRQPNTIVVTELNGKKWLDLNKSCAPETCVKDNPGMDNFSPIKTNTIPRSNVVHSESITSVEKQNGPSQVVDIKDVPHTQATIKVEMPNEGQAEVILLNAQKNEVLKVMRDKLPAGSQSITFDTTNLPAGSYFYRVIANGKVEEFPLEIKK